MQRACARPVFVLVSILAIVGILSNPVLADFKNFGIYQDTNADGVLNPGDTFIEGFMSWYTYYSAASSYNYNNHSDSHLKIDEDHDQPYLTGAPYAADQADDGELSCLFDSPADEAFAEDKLHIYMAWSKWDNAPEQSGENKDGFALAMIANNYTREAATATVSGGYDLDIAINNDGTSWPQVTLSDDYIDKFGNVTGRPPAPGILDPDALEQEYYKIAPGPAPYDHYFQGRWDYTENTGDGGVISGIHNIDYDIVINPSDIVQSISADGLVIRIDPLAFRDVDTIVFYDFGYSEDAVDTLGDTVPLHYAGNTANFDPLRIEIAADTAASKTLFIASIPVPEPSGLLSLLILGTIVVLGRRRGKNRM